MPPVDDWPPTTGMIREALGYTMACVLIPLTLLALAVLMAECR